MRRRSRPAGAVLLVVTVGVTAALGWGCAPLPQRASVTTTTFLPPTFSFQSIPPAVVFVPTGDFCADLRTASLKSSVSADPTTSLSAIGTLITEAPPELADVFDLLAPLFAKVSGPGGPDADSMQAVIQASQDPKYQAAITKLQAYAHDRCGLEGVL